MYVTISERLAFETKIKVLVVLRNPFLFQTRNLFLFQTSSFSKRKNTPTTLQVLNLLVLKAFSLVMMVMMQCDITVQNSGKW